MRRFVAAESSAGSTGSNASVLLKLRVCSYNLLAERYTRDGQHDYVCAGAGAHPAAARAAILDAPARARRVLRELDHYAPDICALQEVQRDVRDGPLREWMHLRGYSGAWVAKGRRLRGKERTDAAARAARLAGGGGGGGGSGGSGSGSNGSSGSSGSGSSSDDGGGSGSDPAGAADAAPSPSPAPAAPSPDDEGVALLWRDALLERADQDAAGGGGFRFSDAAPASRLLSEFGDAAVVAVLRHRTSGEALVAASAHLFWDPTRAEVKARQAALLARRCASLARRWHGGEGDGSGAGGGPRGMLPVVMAGDWNSMPPPELLLVAAGAGAEAGGGGDVSQEEAVRRAEAAAAGSTHAGSGVYRLFTTGSLPPAHADHPAAAAAAAAAEAAQEPRSRRRQHHSSLSTRGLKLASAHAAARGGREPELTTRTATFSGALDHVFFSVDAGGSGGGGSGGGAPAPSCWRVAATLEMPALDGPIPDERWPSDHLAVGADLELVMPSSD